MNEITDKLLEMIDKVKTKISDSEYKNLIETLQEKHNEEKNPRFVKIKYIMTTIKFRKEFELSYQEVYDTPINGMYDIGTDIKSVILELKERPDDLYDIICPHDAIKLGFMYTDDAHAYVENANSHPLFTFKEKCNINPIEDDDGTTIYRTSSRILHAEYLF